MGNRVAGAAGVDLADTHEGCFPTVDATELSPESGGPTSSPDVCLSCPCTGKKSAGTPLSGDKPGCCLSHYLKVWAFRDGKRVSLYSAVERSLLSKSKVCLDATTCYVMLLVCSSEDLPDNRSLRCSENSPGNLILKSLSLECATKMDCCVEKTLKCPVYSSNVDSKFRPNFGKDKALDCACSPRTVVYLLQGRSTTPQTINKTKQFTDNLIECLRKLPEGGFSFSQIPKLFQFQQRYARNRIAVIPFVSDAALLFDADRDCEAQNGVDIAPFLLSNSRCVSSSCRTVKSQGCNGTDTTSEAPRCRPVNFKNSISPRTLSAALAEASPTIAALAVSPRGVRSVFTRPPETCLPQPCPKNSLVSALHSREQPLEAVSADCPSHRSDRFSRNQGSNHANDTAIASSFEKVSKLSVGKLKIIGKNEERDFDAGSNRSVEADSSPSSLRPDFFQEKDCSVPLEHSAEGGDEKRSERSSRGYHQAVESQSTPSLSDVTKMKKYWDSNNPLDARSPGSPPSNRRFSSSLTHSSDSYDSSASSNSEEGYLDGLKRHNPDTFFCAQDNMSCESETKNSFPSFKAAKRAVPELRLTGLSHSPRSQRPTELKTPIKRSSRSPPLSNRSSSARWPSANSLVSRSSLSSHSSYNTSVASDAGDLDGENGQLSSGPLSKRWRGSITVPDLKLSALPNFLKSLPPLSPKAVCPRLGRLDVRFQDGDTSPGRNRTCRHDASLAGSDSAALRSEGAGLVDTFDSLPESKDVLLERYRAVCSIIAPGERIYISGSYVAQNYKLLREKRITHIVNLAGDTCQNFFRSEFSYLTFVLHVSSVISGGLEVVRLQTLTLDNRYSSEELHAILFYVLEYIDFCLQDASNRVLIHCREGVSRSATVAVAYLMWKRKTSFTEALDVLRSSRPPCNPNTGFTFVLLRFGKLLATQENCSALSSLTDQSCQAMWSRKKTANEFGLVRGKNSVDLVVQPFSRTDSSRNDSGNQKPVAPETFVSGLWSLLPVVPAPCSVRELPLTERRLLRFSVHHRDAPFLVLLGVSLFEPTQGQWMPHIKNAIDPRFYYVLRDDDHIYFWRGAEALHCSLTEAVFVSDYVRHLHMFEGGPVCHDWRFTFVEGGKEPKSFWRLLSNRGDNSPLGWPEHVRHQSQLDESYALLDTADDLCNFHAYCSYQNSPSYSSPFDVVVSPDWDDISCELGSGRTNATSARYQLSAASSRTAAFRARNPLRCSLSSLNVPVSTSLLSTDVLSARSAQLMYASPESLKVHSALSCSMSGHRGNLSNRNTGGRSIAGHPYFLPTVRRRFTVASPSSGFLPKDGRLSLLPSTPHVAKLLTPTTDSTLLSKQIITLPPFPKEEHSAEQIGPQRFVRARSKTANSPPRPLLSPSEDLAGGSPYVLNPYLSEADEINTDEEEEDEVTLFSKAAEQSVPCLRVNKEVRVCRMERQRDERDSFGALLPQETDTMPSSAFSDLGTDGTVVTASMKTVRVREGAVELEPNVPYLYIWPNMTCPLDVFDDDNFSSDSLCIVAFFGPKPLLEMLTHRHQNGKVMTSAVLATNYELENDDLAQAPSDISWMPRPPSPQVLVVVADSFSAEKKNAEVSFSGSCCSKVNVTAQTAESPRYRPSWVRLRPVDNALCDGSIDVSSEAACGKSSKSSFRLNASELPSEKNASGCNCETVNKMLLPGASSSSSFGSMDRINNQPHTPQRNFSASALEPNNTKNNESPLTVTHPSRRSLYFENGSSPGSAEFVPHVKEIEVVAAVTPTTLWVWRGHSWISNQAAHPSDEFIVEQFKASHGILPEDEDVCICWETEGEESSAFQEVLWLS